MLLYVDDILIPAKNIEDILSVKKMLGREFDMKDLGEAKKLLGMEITQDSSSGRLSVSRRKYLEKVLARFGMSNAKPVSTPLASHFRSSCSSCPAVDSEEPSYMAQVPYSSTIGSLMYAMVSTHPDLAHAMSVVSWFLTNPGKAHWTAMKYILRYLRDTSDFSLLFDRDMDSSDQVTGFISGYVFVLCGCVVNWKAQLQPVVALSTVEIELIVLGEAIKEVFWFHLFLLFLGVPYQRKVVFCDNQNAIYVAKDERFHERTKHIDVKYFFMRVHIRAGDIEVTKIGLKENPIDMFTKSLVASASARCVNLVGVRPCLV